LHILGDVTQALFKRANFYSFHLLAVFPQGAPRRLLWLRRRYAFIHHKFYAFVFCSIKQRVSAPCIWLALCADLILLKISLQLPSNVCESL
jgi:hypothetical protein